MIGTKDVPQDLKDKILKRTEFKISIDTLTVWTIAVKDPEDFRRLMTALIDFCRDFTVPDFSDAKDPALLKQLFKMEAAKQKNAAIKYATMCIKNTDSGRKGGQASAKRTQANAKRTRADNDNDNDIDSGHGHGLGIGIGSEEPDTDTDNDHPTSPAPEGGSSSEIVGEKLPQNFWGDEDV